MNSYIVADLCPYLAKKEVIYQDRFSVGCYNYNYVLTISDDHCQISPIELKIKYNRMGHPDFQGIFQGKYYRAANSRTFGLAIFRYFNINNNQQFGAILERDGGLFSLDIYRFARKLGQNWSPPTPAMPHLTEGYEFDGFDALIVHNKMVGHNNLPTLSQDLPKTLGHLISNHKLKLKISPTS